MTYYRKDLFARAGLTMPAKPTYADIKQFAAAIHDPAHEVYGICLRGKPGWGENMAYIATLVNAFGGRWFDEQWRPTINTPAWRAALTLYADLAAYSPPSLSRNGFTENLALFAAGHCGIWIDDSHFNRFSVSHYSLASIAYPISRPSASCPPARPGYGRGRWRFRFRPKCRPRR